ncbi:phage holin family protein [Actinomadura fibrosa]|uniref:Phage holin family protein n=1 Tax=Actinomadura fibrosa TaxID=111802 RepID=A0ABW2XGN4_9ACTN|nr:phage holin family protein [Actinomadura fibrosa]
MSTQRAPGSGSEPGVGELVKQAAEQIPQLVRAEMRLAVAEMKDKGRHAGKGAGLFGGAGLVALYGAGALVAAAIAALALALPVWAAALIVGAVLLAVAAVLGVLGRGQVRQAGSPVPEQAIESIQQDVTEIKESARR